MFKVVPDVEATTLPLYVTLANPDAPITVFLLIVMNSTHLSFVATVQLPAAPETGNGVAYSRLAEAHDEHLVLSSFMLQVSQLE